MKPKIQFAIKLILALFSTALTILVAECAYRIYLGWKLSAVDLGTRTVFAYSAPLHRFHPVVGYEYIASTDYTEVVFQRDKPLWVSRQRINSIGNVGRENSFKSASKIFIFGDSFTMAQRQGLTWPDHLQDLLRKGPVLDCQVRNYARDGFGIVQMVKLAAEVLTEEMPDVCVFAFVSDDLTRGTSWRSNRVIDGRVRVLTSLKQDERPSIEDSADSYLVYPPLRGIETPVADDSTLIQALVTERNRIIAERAFFVPLRSLRRSFLAARLFKGDPLHGIEHPSQLLRIDADSFEDLPDLQDAIRQINAAPCQTIIFHLPTHYEIENGEYRLTAQELSLKNSLSETLNAPCRDLIAWSSNKDKQHTDSLRWPFDAHPSDRGIKEYARLAFASLDWSNVLTRASASP